MTTALYVAIGALVVGLVICMVAQYKTRRDTNEEIVKFRMYWESGDSTEHLIMRGHVARMLDATLQLHHKPGKNPHNHGETAKAVKITVQAQASDNVKTKYELTPSGPYWWTTPGLKDNFDPAGAITFDHDTQVLSLLWSKDEEVIWERPEEKEK